MNPSLAISVLIALFLVLPLCHPSKSGKKVCSLSDAMGATGAARSIFSSSFSKRNPPQAAKDKISVPAPTETTGRNFRRIKPSALAKASLTCAVASRLAERTAGHDLTGREVQVLELIAKGETDREIGADLGIAEGTAKWHVNSVIGKLQVSNRTEAATTALRRGIIHLD